MLISQSFLLTAAITSQSGGFLWWFGPTIAGVLGVLGVWLNLRGTLAIHAAQAIIEKGWLAKARELYSKDSSLDSYRIGRVIHQTGKSVELEHDYLHEEAVKLHKQIGYAFIMAWVVVFILAFLSGFMRAFPEYHLVIITPLRLGIAGAAAFSIAVLGFLLTFWERFKQLNDAAMQITGNVTGKKTGEHPDKPQTMAT